MKPRSLCLVLSLLLLAPPLSAKAAGKRGRKALRKAMAEAYIPPPPEAPIDLSPYGAFLGLGGSVEWTGGGFDGQTLRVTSGSVSILCPRLDPGAALSLHGGLKGPLLPGPFAELWGELWLKRSQQRWVFQDGWDASVRTSLALRGRSAFLRRGQVEVFALTGLRYDLMELKNAAEEPGYVIGDAAFWDLGVEAGAGALLDLFEDYRARLDGVFLLGAVTSGSAFGSALKDNPQFLGGSLEFSIERYF